MTRIGRITGLAAMTLVGVGLTFATANSELAMTAEATHQPAADYRPNTDLDPYCQWSLESGRKVLVIAEEMSRASVDIGHVDSGYEQTVTGYPEFRRIPQRMQLAWVQLPKDTQEDEIGIIQAEIKGEWYICEPA
jgi:hypothetical protein